MVCIFLSTGLPRLYAIAGEWAGIFGDAKMTIARLDRLTRHCHSIETANDGFRRKDSAAKPQNRKDKSTAS